MNIFKKIQLTIWNSDFMLFVANARDPLVFRALMGEKLSIYEKIKVACYNMMIRVAIPGHQKLPKHVRKALKEIEKLRLK